ncbi:hypothetical protein E1301_Tti008606 [Triplophysa tibetana]|uniref:HAT C-terminal dimerisation domain-containing protein n=1 Tax=Triplophysa tibetana TaxID=1572043 RepID=A0A5A9NU86_9TELE|nr:hypothetical protein E1301_Tti008606 [Triplophysa tibetana]
MADSANIVDLILAKPLESLPYEEKLRIKQQGRSTPKIDLVKKIGKSNRSFQLSWYDKVSWLTGSAVKKKMYCWPCLLMKPSHGCVVWSKFGFGDLSNFDRAYKRHENSNEHVSAYLESMLFLELVNPGKFDDMRQAFPEEAFQSVLKSYGHHFDSGRLRSELQVLYSDQDLQSNRGKLCDYLVFLKDMELDSAMPQLYKLFSLVATIGATSAGVERSFSCLKRLKSYTRNTMGQGRLSSLALLAIERTLVKSLEKTPSWYDRVTEHFLEKERRAEFTYK